MAEPHRALERADLAMGLTHAPRSRGVQLESRVAEPVPAPRMAPSSVEAPTPAATRPAAEAPGVAAVIAVKPDQIATRAIPPSDRDAALEHLRDRHDRECPHCTTATAHTRTVFGEGASDARLMFVGEAPGETEDQLGRPFVGRAGEKLDEMIAAMGLRREQVYIANVLKSRPPDNRTPLQHEVDACGPFLLEQIGIVRPEVIVTLGGPATKLLLGTEVGITRLRGAWQQWKGHGGSLVIPVMPTYHPAYLLRNYTAKTRGEVWSDLKAVMSALGLPGR